MFYLVKWRKDGKHGIAGFTQERGWFPCPHKPWRKPFRSRQRSAAESGAAILAKAGYETEVVEENE